MRFQFNFWLDDKDNQQSQLIEDIRELKRLRMFSASVRDGLRLIISLRNGSVEVLEELFPLLYSWIKSELVETVFKELMVRNKELQRELDAIKSNQVHTLPITPRYVAPMPEPELIVTDAQIDAETIEANLLDAFDF